MFVFSPQTQTVSLSLQIMQNQQFIVVDFGFVILLTFSMSEEEVQEKKKKKYAQHKAQTLYKSSGQVGLCLSSCDVYGLHKYLFVFFKWPAASIRLLWGSPEAICDL